MARNNGYPRWYAVYTGPQMEDDASLHLRRQGYWIFYPHVRTKVRRGARRQLVEVNRPLFPRYLFVAFRGRPGESFGQVRNTYGVSTPVYVPSSNPETIREPLEIPSDVMTEIMDRTDGTGLVHQIKPRHWFKGKPGDMLRMVEDAPFFGLLASLSSIAALDERNEISIWLTMFGSKREIECVPVSAVAAVL